MSNVEEADSMDEVIKKILKGSLIALVFTHGLAFFGGMYINGIVNSGDRIAVYQEQLANVTNENANYKLIIINTNAENENLKLENATLRRNYEEATQNYNRLVGEDAQMRQKLISLQTDYDYLKMRYSILENSCGYDKSGTSTEVLTQGQEQVSVPVTTTPETYSPGMTYPPMSARGTTPYPTTYTTVTQNVIKFSKGLTVGEIVNNIRFKISYLDHYAEGYPYLIQYADETLVKGKGDCTDKALLLFSCLAANGYPVSDMGIAAISKCDGQMLHDVLIIKNPPINTDGFGKYHFNVDGETFYIIDPTNSLSTSVYEISPQYKDCLIVGNVYFQDPNKGKGWMPYKIQ